MRRMLMLLGAMALAGGAYAACTGPYCYDDQGAYVTSQSLYVNTLKAGLESATTTQMAAKAPNYTAQLLYCSAGCVNAGTVCISTGTGKGAWILFNSTPTVNGVACDQ